MFTGIIQDIGSVARIDRKTPWELRVRAITLPSQLAIGDSVSVSGICVTVVGTTRNQFSVQISKETVNRTTVATLRIKDSVNLELPLKITDRFDGHMVQGHIDDVGQIVRITGKQEKVITIRPRNNPLAKLVLKGSVALDGVSLTVSQLKTNGDFAVTLIPLTLKKTTLGNIRVGQYVNIEYDIIGKYVAQIMKI